MSDTNKNNTYVPDKFLNLWVFITAEMLDNLLTSANSIIK